MGRSPRFFDGNPAKLALTECPRGRGGRAGAAAPRGSPLHPGLTVCRSGITGWVPCGGRVSGRGQRPRGRQGRNPRETLAGGAESPTTC